MGSLMDIKVLNANLIRFVLIFNHIKAWFPYGRYRSLGIVDGLSQSLEYLGRWESLPIVGGLSVPLTVFHGR